MKEDPGSRDPSLNDKEVQIAGIKKEIANISSEDQARKVYSDIFELHYNGVISDDEHSDLREILGKRLVEVNLDHLYFD